MPRMLNITWPNWILKSQNDRKMYPFALFEDIYLVKKDG